MKVNVSRINPPFGACLTCWKAGVSVEWCNETKLSLTDSFSLTTSHAISRYIARLHPNLNLYPTHILQRTEVDHWLSVASGPLSCSSEVTPILQQLNEALAPSSYLTANQLTLADLEVFSVLYKSSEWNKILANGNKKDNYIHIQRWYNSILAEVTEGIQGLPADVQNNLIQLGSKGGDSGTRSSSAATGGSGGKQSKVKREDRGKFVDLPDAKMGEVVVRFPPEASGYLHIGHAKAALLNQYYQDTFKGKLIMRFDDTNPAKEKADYEKVILEDLKLLNIKPDIFTHSSDHFDRMIGMCALLIQQGHAYVDDTDAETMKKEREERKESQNRNNSVDKNIKMWEEMKKGTQVGQTCAVRAKINMNSDNGCLRDPTIYRCKTEPHVQTGIKYKVYPTYDFACPIVDSVEGVTHALRTTEYHDRDDQYFWFIEKLCLRKVHIYEYSRLNMNNTVLSKRKLAWFVDEGYVDGWDDPRFPTVRGIIRKGMTIEGLKEFIIAQGSSRSVVNMEWDKIWAFNKKVIDRDAPRYTALQGDLIPVNVAGVRDEPKSVPLHPKGNNLGNKRIWISSHILIEAVDAAELKEGENATFINWGNLMIKKINYKDGIIESVDAETNLSNTDYKKTLKLTWLSDTFNSPQTSLVCVYFDNIINKSILGKDENFKDFINPDTRFEVKMTGDEQLRDLAVGDIIQLQRKGFFRVDEAAKTFSPSSCREGAVVLFAVPDGHSKEMPTATSAKKLAGMSEKEKAQSAKGKTGEKSPIVENASSIEVSPNSNNFDELNKKIKDQGLKVRDLKSAKAEKSAVMAEVNVLLSFKAEFLKVAGVAWTPEIDAGKLAKAPSPPKVTGASNTTIDNCKVMEVCVKIKTQGDIIRNLKTAKADKQIVKTEIDILLDLKKDFKNITNVDWKPDIDVTKLVPSPVASSQGSEPSSCSSGSNNNAREIHDTIKKQGDMIRNLKNAKSDKETIKSQVEILLTLKKDFKTIVKVDWKPDLDINEICISTVASPQTSTTPASSSEGNSDVSPQTSTTPASSSEGNSDVSPQTSTTPASSSEGNSDVLKIHENIKKQGEEIRDLKTSKAEKDVIKAKVEVLLALKKDFKNIANVDWKPDIDISKFNVTSCPQEGHNKASEIHALIKEQGDKVRDLKTAKAEKSAVMVEVQKLLELKKEFKAATNVEWKPDLDISQFTGSQPVANIVTKKASPERKVKTNAKQSSNKVSDTTDEGTSKKQTRLGLEVSKYENFSEWYSQVITKSEMIEYYNVSGCYILRPWSYAIWEYIKDFFDKEIKKLGVENAYFPIFVSRDALEREKDHIADFSPEVAWVTRSGSSDLAEPIAIRPTSETVMYPAFAKWIQSHRDLPLKINQWNNVVRWEFKQPTPFIRTREFLWQEGHSAFATKAEAETEVYQIVELYNQIYEDLLAIPVVKGKKTEKEKFAGGDYTTTTEAFISASGRAIQGATSHHLGQNFSKMFEIVFEDPKTKEKQFVYQNSWGCTTRSIGVMVMVHGDDKGIVLPPRVAAVQVIIMHVGCTAKTSDTDKNSLIQECDNLKEELCKGGIRARTDMRDNITPAWKFNHWELKGVPIRVELGPREVASGQVFVVRRDNGEKQTFPRHDIEMNLTTLLTTIHKDMFNKAKEDLTSHIKQVYDWKDFTDYLDQGNLLLTPFCGEEKCEDEIKKDSARDEGLEAGAPSMGAKSLCIPFDAPPSNTLGTKCIHPKCSKKPQFFTLFGRSY